MGRANLGAFLAVLVLLSLHDLTSAITIEEFSNAKLTNVPHKGASATPRYQTTENSTNGNITAGNSTTGPQKVASGKIIMDYIGANGKDIYLKDIPVNDSIAFNFILSFAIDSDRDGNSQNGVFDGYWQSTLTGDSVATLKSKHPNVRVLMSLTGWSIYTNAGEEKVIYWYDPKDEEKWLQNGVDSLTKLVQTYHLDGIDVDYEKIPDNSRFVPLVGELLTRLKANGTIKIATLAPYTATNQVYSALFKNFSSVIDYVNYQFFTEIVANASDFVSRYNNLATYSYSYDKLIPGYEVNGIGLQGQNFTDAVAAIKNSTAGLNGIMIYSADDGLTNNWYYEKEFQALLLQ